MAANKKDIGKLLRKFGYAMPKSQDEVKSFEEKFSRDYVSPKKWPEIQDVIGRDNSSSTGISIDRFENKAARNLAMAARDGKKISKRDREQMDKDKKNAKKK
jgi:hypothetical protein|tara:strand:- start:4936 stop:5241 length:306 start_codon:yes stop_codon:yes gene_type:complete